MMVMMPVRDVRLNVEDRGAGPAVVLLHGFPHTWRVWDAVLDDLAVDHRVVAPDLRGFGASSRTPDAMDADTLARDVECLVDTVGPAVLVGLDAGGPPAFLLATRRPDLVAHLVLVETTLGRLPGAEDFFAAGPPWWFGFHAVPGLAERVLAGHEDDYVGWFFDQGTRDRGVRPELRAAFAEAYAAPGALASALGYYRSLPRSATQLASAGRLAVPTTAVGADPVGRALADQLRPRTDRLTGHLLDDCGHIVPVDRPDLLIPIIRRATRPVMASPGRVS